MKYSGSTCPVCPECPDKACLVLAEVILPNDPNDKISIDPSSRKLVYSTSPNYIGTWLVLGPIFDPAHQLGGHSDKREYDHGHHWAGDIVNSIDENLLKLLSNSGWKDAKKEEDREAGPQRGDYQNYGGEVFVKRTYEWRERSFSGMDWSNIHSIEDNMHRKLPGDWVDDPFDPRNNLNFAGKHHVLAFLLVYIPAREEERRTKLYLRSDDAVRVWLNGEEITKLSFPKDRDIKDYTEYCADITIKNEKEYEYNTLLIAVANTHVEWGFSARIEDDEGFRFTTERPDTLYAGQPACESEYRVVAIVGEGDGWDPEKSDRLLFCEAHRGWKEVPRGWKEVPRGWKGRVRMIHLNERFKFVGFKGNGKEPDWWGKKGKNSSGDSFDPLVPGVYDMRFDEDDATHPTFTLVKAFEGLRG